MDAQQCVCCCYKYFTHGGSEKLGSVEVFVPPLKPRAFGNEDGVLALVIIFP